MTYKIIELTLKDRDKLFMVSPIDCVNIDIARYSYEPVINHHVYVDEFDSIAGAWHFIGKLLNEQRVTYVFVPNSKQGR